MAKQKRGTPGILFDAPPILTAWASVAGKKESEGPLQAYFDYTNGIPIFGERPGRQSATCRKLRWRRCCKRRKKKKQDVDLVFSGDLLNQCISSSFSLRNTGLPALGLYGACSTMGESLLLASMAVSGGFADQAVAMTSSHFASSERQYRYPLGYGGQRSPTAQWTVTGSGAALVCSKETDPL